MKTIHISSCPVCNSPEIKTYIEGEDYFASKEAFNIEKCQSCGFLFTQNFPAEEYIGSYYESPDYISHSDSQKGLINSLYHKVRSYMLKSKARLIEEQTPRKGSLLDIGAGTGYFANEMKKRAWDVSAIEKNSQARQFIKDKWGIEAKDDETLSNLPGNSFDVITLWHVLEHLEHLNEVMEKLYSILKEDGILIIALPNSASYDARKYKIFWGGYDLPRHLWHFNPETFKLLASQHGFEVKKTKRMPFDVFYVSLLSERYRKKLFGVFRAVFWGSIGWLESGFNIKNTSSLIYVLKKK